MPPQRSNVPAWREVTGDQLREQRVPCRLLCSNSQIDTRFGMFTNLTENPLPEKNAALEKNRLNRRAHERKREHMLAVSHYRLTCQSTVSFVTPPLAGSPGDPGQQHRGSLP